MRVIRTVMDVEPVFVVVCHKASLQNLFVCAKSGLDPI
jgi:hypothetical protein